MLAELKIASIDVISVSKDEGSHTKGLTQEKIFLPGKKDPLLFAPRSPLLFLLQQIRDEAHRTAIAFHRKRRGKHLLASQLDDIPGIGPIKKKRLLQHFGSVKAIRNGSAEEWRKVKGITAKDLEKLIEWQKE